jgi:hypothetical protein
MEHNGTVSMSTIPTVTDAEIKSARKQLGLDSAHLATSHRKSNAGQVLQRLAHGRSHMVAVEIRLSPRRSPMQGVSLPGTAGIGQSRQRPFSGMLPQRGGHDGPLVLVDG